MTLGKFIALEGGEGAGKSTQARLLAETLEARGIEVVVTREPGGTDGAEAIRQLLLHPPGEGWNAKAEALLFAAARSDHIEHLIRPALQRGAWVICDRFVDSSRAYQGGAGQLGDEAILQLHQFGSEGFRPDLTLLLDVEPCAVAERLAARDGETQDAIGGRDNAYHQAVTDSFRRIAKAAPDQFAVIDASTPAGSVHDNILQAISPLLDSRT